MTLRFDVFDHIEPVPGQSRDRIYEDRRPHSLSGAPERSRNVLRYIACTASVSISSARTVCAVGTPVPASQPCST